MCSGIYLAFHVAYSSGHGFQKSRGKTDTSGLYEYRNTNLQRDFCQLELNVLLLLVAYEEMSHKGKLIFLESK